MVGKKIRYALLANFLWISILAGTSLGGESRTVEVVPNIFTTFHGAGIDSNSTFIISRDGVVVFDTRTSPGEAELVLKEIRKRTDLPILYSINSHYHGDHTFGNQVFNDSKVIIAHKNVRKLLISPAGKEHLEFFKTFNLPGMEGVKITLPTVVFEKKLEVYPGEYHLQLMHLGPGHTNGDVIAYLKEIRTVFTGDLVFNKKHPYMGDGYVESWIHALDTLENMDIETVIPGHGKPGGKPLIIAMKHYLLELKTHVTKALEQGKTLKETQDAARPIIQEKYKDWIKQEWIDNNIKRAYLEYSLKLGS